MFIKQQMELEGPRECEQAERGVVLSSVSESVVRPIELKIPSGAPGAGLHVVSLVLRVFSGTLQTAVVSEVPAAVSGAQVHVGAAALSEMCPPLMHTQTEIPPWAQYAGQQGPPLHLDLLVDPHLQKQF